MMPLRVALQMDPPHGLNPRGDTSLLLGREAQRRGSALFYYAPESLTVQEGRVTARACPITLYDSHTRWYDTGEAFRLDLATLDVVLLRQDPPFDMAYITSTYLLDMLPATTLVVNNPASVRNHPEKLLPLRWPEYMPPTLISADEAEIEAFRSRHRDIIIKPLYGHGGNAILRVQEEDGNLPAILEMHRASSRLPLMVQRFLPEVRTDDRRIILIDGEVRGVMGRIPAENEIRANFRVGGTPARAELTPRQREICAAVSPVLREKGLLFAGLDVIGDWLTEINITSPTGMVQMNALNGTTLEADFWDAVEKKRQYQHSTPG